MYATPFDVAPPTIQPPPMVPPPVATVPGPVPSPVVPPVPVPVPVPMAMPVPPKPKKTDGMSVDLVRSALSTYSTLDMGPGAPQMGAGSSPTAQGLALKPGWGGGK